MSGCPSCGTLQKKPISLPQHPKYWGGTSMTAARGRLGKRQRRISEGITGYGSFWLCSASRKSTYELLGALHSSISPLGLWTPQMSQVPNPNFPYSVASSSACYWVRGQKWTPINRVLSENQLRICDKGEITSLNCSTTSWKIKEKFSAANLLRHKNWRYKHLRILPWEGERSVD